MSGFFRAVGQIAGAVATVASIVSGPGLLVGVAAGVAAISGTAAQLTAGRPDAKGSVQGFLIGSNQPLPYLIGEAYTEGVEVHRVGYGGEVDDVDNPYAFLVRVLSCCGPIESMGSSLVNYESTSFTGSVGSVQEASGYYENYLYIDQQLGARPESDALKSPDGGSVPNWPTPTNWSTSHKLSGFAAVAWSLEWSKKGRRFAGGQIPPLGKVPQGVKVYDPRLDGTYPGGSGTHRIDDEDTWEYSRNPALHALAYAYGRIMNGEPIFGVRLFDTAAIDMAAVVAWANVCDANGWTVNGVIYEPENKWNNLKRICEAGACQPVAGSVLGFDYQAPRTSLYTVTLDDLAGPISASLGRGWRERHNVLTPRYRSAVHDWNYVQAARVEVSAWITADGEEKLDERQWDLVTDVDQVTELATYDLYQRREAGPIEIVCKPHMRIYPPGSCLTLSEEIGAHPDGEIKAVVRRIATDIETATVTLTLEQETDAKHTAALGLTGTAPPTTTRPTQQEIEESVTRNEGSSVLFADIAPFNIQADDTGATTTSLPLTRQLSLTSNGEDVTADATWSVAGTSGGITASVNASGELSLSVADAPGSITVEAAFEGVTYTRVAQVNRTTSSGTSGGGSGATSYFDSSWSNTLSTSFEEVAGSALVESDGSGELSFSANASYYCVGTVTIKAQYSTDGTTWTDAGSASTGSSAPPPETGFVSLSRTVTGLTASTDYHVRLVAKVDTSGSTASWLSPSFLVTHPA